MEKPDNPVDYLDQEEQWYDDHAYEFVPAEHPRPQIIEAARNTLKKNRTYEYSYDEIRHGSA
ncbi:hypothetical protein [Spirochaeta dissipatitropha]